MSKWDDFDGGRLANERTQRLIDKSKAEDRRRAWGWLLAGVLFTLFLIAVASI